MSPMEIAALSLVAVLLLAILILQVKKRRLSNELSKAKEEIRKSRDRCNILEKYQQVIDAEEEAASLKKGAEQEARNIKGQADRILSNAETVSNNLKKEAHGAANVLKEKAQSALDHAVSESKRIVQSANNQAEEIAGDAYKAKRNADHYEATAKAMKRAIEGYGDEYIVPNRSVLDDLAEEFSHKDAGIDLKKARLRTKSMVKNQIAADCDYVEAARRSTAIHFVLDAFNGKVDSILSKVKHDNYGKLSKEIRDAFALVNGNGRAFRNAVINHDFLETRLDELKWAVAVNELKLEEREEQRRIKEAIREEDRARREYEKAIKDAQKEEQILEKAMEKAKSQLAAANEEQKLKFEQQLAELQQKYDEVEARNQRAISMAQQTRQGHVYVISNIGSFGEDVFKIGMTRRLEPLVRVKELGDASVPFEFDVHAMIHSEDAPALEKELHRQFVNQQVNKVNSRKEFFRVGASRIRELVEGMGVKAHWTMAADAKEYHESKAMESARLKNEAAETEALV